MTAPVRRIHFVSTLGLLLAVGLPGLASETLAQAEAALEAAPDDPPLLLRVAKLAHNEAAFGGREPRVLEGKAEKALRRVLELQPTNAFARALLGSTRTLGARHAFLPTTKIRLVKEGLKEMDLAVESAPEDPQVRFTRAANNLFLPDLFGRKETVLGDLRWLSERVLREPDRHEEEFRQYALLYAGMAERRYGELDKAVRLWQSGLSINPDSKVADRIRLETTRKPS